MPIDLDRMLERCAEGQPRLDDIRDPAEAA